MSLVELYHLHVSGKLQLEAFRTNLEEIIEREVGVCDSYFRRPSTWQSPHSESYTLDMTFLSNTFKYLNETSFVALPELVSCEQIMINEPDCSHINVKK